MSSPVYQKITCTLVAAANTDEELSKTVALPGSWQVESISLVDNDGITGDASDYVTFTVTDGTTTIATRTTDTGGSGSTITAQTPEFLTLAGDPNDRHFDQGDVLVFAHANTGATGVAVATEIAVVLKQVR